MTKVIILICTLILIFLAFGLTLTVVRAFIEEKRLAKQGKKSLFYKKDKGNK